MEIRTLEQKDLPEITRFAKKMLDLHHSLDSYYKSSDEFTGLNEEVSGWLNDPNSLVLVTEDNGKLLGYFRISVENAPAYAKAKKIGVVDDIFVDEKYRRQGVGKALFEKGMEWFGKKKVSNIELNVDARNSEGITAWRSLGFKDYKLRMRLDK